MPLFYCVTFFSYGGERLANFFNDRVFILSDCIDISIPARPFQLYLVCYLKELHHLPDVSAK